MQFFVFEPEGDFDDKAMPNMHIIEAASHGDALEIYKRRVLVKDPYIRAYLLKQGFDERFWTATDRERSQSVDTGRNPVSPEVFRRRVALFFGERADLADAYLSFYFGDEKTRRFPDTLYPGLVAHLLSAVPDYVNLVAVPVKDAPVLAAA